MIITLIPLPVPTSEHLWPANSPLPELLRCRRRHRSSAYLVAAHRENYEAVNWLALATAIYACAAGMLLLRLAVGIF